MVWDIFFPEVKILVCWLEAVSSGDCFIEYFGILDVCADNLFTSLKHHVACLLLSCFWWSITLGDILVCCSVNQTTETSPIKKLSVFAIYTKTFLQSRFLDRSKELFIITTCIWLRFRAIFEEISLKDCFITWHLLLCYQLVMRLSIPCLSLHTFFLQSLIKACLTCHRRRL